MQRLMGEGSIANFDFQMIIIFVFKGNIDLTCIEIDPDQNGAKSVLKDAILSLNAASHFTIFMRGVRTKGKIQ